MYVMFLKIMEFTRYSTGLSVGNLVDVLPGAHIIPKHSGGARGCLGQRLLVLWTKQRLYIF